MRHAVNLEGLIGALETDSGLLQMLADFFAVCGETISGRTPLVKSILETFAADADPVCFKHGGVMLNLWLKLCRDLLIQLDKQVSQLAHRIGIYVNRTHCNVLLKYRVRKWLRTHGKWRLL